MASHPQANSTGATQATPADADVVPGGPRPEPETRPGVEPGPEAGGARDTEDLERLRTELSELRTRLDTRQRRAYAMVAFRRVTAAILAAITAFALVAGVVAIWSANTALNTDRWVETVTPLPRDPKVATAVAEYTTAEVFKLVDVENRLQEVLPPRATFVAGPLTGQVREAVTKTVYRVVQSDQAQRIWVEVNRRAHQRALAILEGTSDVVIARSDRVDIDLLPLINQVLRVLSAQLPTLFGKQLTLPDLSSGEIPTNLQVRVEDALGVTLPANFAQFTVYDSGQLEAIQQAVKTAKRGLILFVVGTFLLLALALLISPQRRRTLLQLGLWLVVAAVAVTAILRRVREQLLLEVPAGTYREGVAAALTTIFALLRQRGTQLIWIGALLALLAYLVGPGRVPVWLRRQVARGAGEAGRWTGRGTRALATHGPAWTAGHLDAIRVAGIVVAAVLALILSSWTSLLVIAVALAAFELLVTLVGRATPPATTVVPTEPPAGLAGPT